MTPRSAGRLGLEFLRGRGLKLVWVAQQMGISDRHLSNTLADCGRRSAGSVRAGAVMSYDWLRGIGL